MREIVAARLRSIAASRTLDRKDHVPLERHRCATSRNRRPGKRFFEIDWTKEAATERERSIRAVLLRNALAEGPLIVKHLISMMLIESVTHCACPEDAASDFREAYAKGRILFDEAAAKMSRTRLERAIREVDGAHDELSQRFDARKTLIGLRDRIKGIADSD